MDIIIHVIYLFIPQKYFQKNNIPQNLQYFISIAVDNSSICEYEMNSIYDFLSEYEKIEITQKLVKLTLYLKINLFFRSGILLKQFNICQWPVTLVGYNMYITRCTSSLISYFNCLFLINRHALEFRTHD